MIALQHIALIFMAVAINILTDFQTSLDNKISSENNYPFVVEGTVSYSFYDSLNCQYVIAGNVEFLGNHTPNPDQIAIMIQPLGTYDDRPPAKVGIGYSKKFGKNSWSQLLVGKYWYLVWVHDLISDVPLSESVLVDDLNCHKNHILALITFREK